MTDPEIFQFSIAARAFSERARAALADFDHNENVEQLFVAALMLRLGIEARLFEYIEAELPREKRRQLVMKVSEYQASKLLARLTRLNPDATMPAQVTVAPTNDPVAAAGFRYTPVTGSLASIHGRLGELLHFNFFKKNVYRYVRDRVGDGGVRTLLLARDLIAGGLDELDEATSGTLLNHPHFHVAVEEVVADAEADQAIDPPTDA